MHQITKNKVYAAVRNCLDRCIGTHNPLVQATSYIDRLRRDRHWSSQEADEVESMVLRAVQVIIRQPRNECCHDATRDRRRGDFQ